MNELEHLAEFRSILELHEYHPSDDAIEILKETRLVLLIGATATGRNTTITELLKTGEYHYIVSDTTRQPRVNDGVLEENGREYWFRTEEEVLGDLRAGNFLEAEVIHGQQVSGISIRELQNANAANKIAITDIDIGGIQNVMKYKPDTMPILLLPPSFEEWQRRITGRGNMPPKEYKGRMETAARIFQSAIERTDFKIVINNTVEQTAIAVHQFATQMRAEDHEEQQRGKKLAEQLHVETLMLLQTL